MAGPAVHPSWSFEEVVQAGWDAYVGGGIESAGRRLVLVRIWAGLVGSDRAVAELEDFVRGYGIANAARRMNIAVSTLARLRREFQRLPAEGTALGVSRSLKVGERLAGVSEAYIVEGEIGAGGMGRVFRGQRESTGGHVALKLLSTDRFVVNERVRQRFLRESQIARTFEHPNLIRSFEAVLHRGLLVSVIEYLPGNTLESLLRRERIEVGVGMQIMVQLAGGLSELHVRDIVHRDLTPKNIMFRATGEAALGDFGVARSTADPTVTISADQMGSLIYISPQQREDPHEARSEDDVYSLGQVFFYIVTGINPHNAGSMAQHEHEYPRHVSELVEEMRSYKRRDRPRDGRAVQERLLRST
jgi:serine/threonine protein kinase